MVFNLLFHILVALEDAVVFDLALLQSLVHAEFKSLLVRGHLIGLFLHQFSLRRQNLLMPGVVVLFPFFFLKLMHSALHLMCLLVILLLGQVVLDTLEIEQLCRSFKSVGLLFQSPSVVLEFFGVAIVHCVQFVLVGFG